MKRIPLRVRLTMLMTLVFGLALSGAAFAGIASLGNSLRADTQRNAEAVLSTYLDELNGGLLAPGSPAPQDATQFVYLDSGGNELTAQEYEEILLASIEADQTKMSAATPSVELPPSVIVEPGVVGIEPEGDLEMLQLGEDTIAVGAPILAGDTSVTIAVSSPLQPVTDSTDTLAGWLLLLVPVLTAAISGATWLIVGRALRPVDAITAQVDQISNENLDQRVPASQAHDEIGRLATTMNVMLTRLETTRNLQRQFISDASHELRSPITATQATLEVAKANPERTDWIATSEVLLEENSALAALVDDLLVLSRLEEEGQGANLQDVDLEELCAAESQRHPPDLIHVNVKAPGRVIGDSDQLTRAIRNVVDNATRYANQRVDVVISQDHNASLVEVFDDGPGIPTEDLDQIFERFRQLDTSRTHTHGQGAGLGLAIAKQIITSHGGTIEAANREPGGAVITIRIPTGSGQD